MSNYDYPPPSGEPVQPPPGVAFPPQQSGQSEREQQEQEAEQSRRRVAVTVAALVALLGAVILGLALSGGHGSKPTGHAAGSQSSVAAGAPTGAATARLSVPPAPSAQSSAQAEASALAAGQNFLPPTATPSDVVPYTGSAPLDAVDLPPFLTVSIPGVKASDPQGQKLADQSQAFLRAWVEAWATGNTADPRYRAYCVDACRQVTDPLVTLWARAGIVPAGTVKFTDMAGGISKSDSQSGEVGVCLDDSAVTAMTKSGEMGADPYPQGAPTLFVFGLVYDSAVGHWVVTTGYSHAGDSYCTASGTTS